MRAENLRKLAQRVIGKVRAAGRVLPFGCGEVTDVGLPSADEYSRQTKRSSKHSHCRYQGGKLDDNPVRRSHGHLPVRATIESHFLRQFFTPRKCELSDDPLV